MNKYLEAKKRHHVVWANYLLRWSKDRKNVFYTTKTGKIAHDSVKAIAVDDYFYKLSFLTPTHIEIIKAYSEQCSDQQQQLHLNILNQFLTIQTTESKFRKRNIRDIRSENMIHALKCNALENLHSIHERSASPILAALAEGELDVLQDQQNMIAFMFFLGHQMVRTKTFRDGVAKSLPRRNDSEINHANATTGAWWFLSYLLGMNVGTYFYSSIHDNTHALLINNTPVPFITSDQPIVNVHTCVSETEFVVPLNADCFYPISPTVAYIICDSNRFMPGKNEVDEATAKEFNTKVAAQAMLHIIGNTKEAIQPFQQFICRRNKKIPNRAKGG
ncbi:DUF4238 domain-containing protein [Iodobacter sp. CM08]|uniref:DUF4238 domain-containing protein n=1 Tax=Iodobacter sp. CM08 TaxID=3085902 RepID=UPI0029820A60|nr:DUF4238 domain-containing protein [Iodobacter sp. CM08]MDW5418741.1 DUF4238 domain-containing protein [Iodobacter sp. CM08]